MSKFFVGQRVRIVGGDFPHVIGMETRIIAKAYGEFLRFGYEWIIIVDSEEWGAKSNHLEPILYDGHRASDYSLAELLDPCNQGEGVLA